MASTFELLTRRWRGEASKRGFTVTEVADALREPPDLVWARVLQGELRTIEVASIVVVEPQELTRLGLL